MVKNYLAVDIGASSGRHIIATLDGGKIKLKEIYRFENGMVQRNGHLCWNLDSLFSHIKEGMKKCRAEGIIPESVGIDTWGCDFVLLGSEKKVLGDYVAYRDSRT
ncbi:MAG: rhamnulokinase, partial [Lachnospiraceae bacterium]|nr:rhamnulokinase [Lachnospiraceae bacterium]